jgi:hypothetical protein
MAMLFSKHDENTAQLQPVAFQRLTAAPFPGFLALVNESDQVVGVVDSTKPTELRQERPSLQNLWGFKYFPGNHSRQLRHAVYHALRAEIAVITNDSRSRDQMIEECELRHGLKEHARIYHAADLPSATFHHWHQGRPGTGGRSEAHRRLTRVLNSETWPPDVEWPVKTRVKHPPKQKESPKTPAET